MVMATQFYDARRRDRREAYRKHPPINRPRERFGLLVADPDGQYTFAPGDRVLYQGAPWTVYEPQPTHGDAPTLYWIYPGKTRTSISPFIPVDESELQLMSENNGTALSIVSPTDDTDTTPPDITRLALPELDVDTDITDIIPPETSDRMIIHSFPVGASDEAWFPLAPKPEVTLKSDAAIFSQKKTAVMQAVMTATDDFMSQARAAIAAQNLSFSIAMSADHPIQMDDNGVTTLWFNMALCCGDTDYCQTALWAGVSDKGTAYAMKFAVETWFKLMFQPGGVTTDPSSKPADSVTPPDTTDPQALPPDAQAGQPPQQPPTSSRPGTLRGTTMTADEIKRFLPLVLNTFQWTSEDDIIQHLGKPMRDFRSVNDLNETLRRYILRENPAVTVINVQHVKTGKDNKNSKMMYCTPIGIKFSHFGGRSVLAEFVPEWATQRNTSAWDTTQSWQNPKGMASSPLVITDYDNAFQITGMTTRAAWLAPPVNSSTTTPTTPPQPKDDVPF